MNARWALVGCAFLPAIASCNAVLGIHPPDDWDGSMPGHTTTTSGGHGGSTPSYDSSAAGGRGPVEHAFADWPMPNPPSSGLPNPQNYDFSRKNGIVVDTITGLEWQRALDGGAYAWADAPAYCSGLTLDGGGFRLPSRIELLSIVDFTQTGPLIDSRAFPDTPSEYFWTSSPLAADSSKAWSVHFGFGTIIASGSPATASFRVRCVRSHTP
jgi:uncharacterized protein DUF1566